MFCTEAVDFLHTCTAVTAAKAGHQAVGSVIVADGDHRQQISINGLRPVLLGQAVVIFIYSTHNVKLDQTCRLHGKIIDGAF